MARMEWKQQVEVDGNIVIPFEWEDKTPGNNNFGHAEFQVCLKFKRGKVSEFWVYPVQTHIEEFWHYSGGDIMFVISAYEGLESQGAWQADWCKEHKTMSLSVYSPPDAKFLEIDHHGLSFWRSKVSNA